MKYIHRIPLESVREKLIRNRDLNNEDKEILLLLVDRSLCKKNYDDKRLLEEKRAIIRGTNNTTI